MSEHTIGNMPDIVYEYIEPDADFTMVSHERLDEDTCMRKIKPREYIVIKQGSNRIVLTKQLIERLPALAERWNVL